MGATLHNGNIAIKNKNCFSLTDQMMKLAKTSICNTYTNIENIKLLLFEGVHFK